MYLDKSLIIEDRKLQEKIRRQEEKATMKTKAIQKERLKSIIAAQNREMEASGRKSAVARLDFLKRKAEVFTRYVVCILLSRQGLSICCVDFLAQEVLTRQPKARKEDQLLAEVEGSGKQRKKKMLN